MKTQDNVAELNPEEVAVLKEIRLLNEAQFGKRKCLACGKIVYTDELLHYDPFANLYTMSGSLLSARGGMVDAQA